MSGELLRNCKIIIGAKKALSENSKIIFDPMKYESSIRFNFIQKNSIVHKKKYTAKSVKEWFSACKENGLTDIKLFYPQNDKELDLLGYNSDKNVYILYYGCIVCYYNDRVTYFTADKSCYNIKNKWDILYTERLWENPPKVKKHFPNNFLSLKQALEQIRDFAKTIKFEEFAKTFQKSVDILNGDAEPDNSKEAYYFTLLSEENAKLLRAADNCDVFGAMGSWNDSPPCAAHEMGLDKKYDEISKTLIQEIKKAILYSVNEW